MQKVFLRNSDGKAVVLQLDQNVSYQKILLEARNKFKIAPQKAEVVYNAWKIKEDFKLDLDRPHHIIHVAQKSSQNEDFKKSINSQTKNSIVQSEETRKKASSENISQFVDKLLDNRLKEVKANKHAIVYHDWPDPSDIPLVTQTLAMSVDTIVSQLSVLPIYSKISNDIESVKHSNFFLQFQQKYEQLRGDKVFSEYQYVFPLQQD